MTIDIFKNLDQNFKNLDNVYQIILFTSLLIVSILAFQPEVKALYALLSLEKQDFHLQSLFSERLKNVILV